MTITVLPKRKPGRPATGKDPVTAIRLPAEIKDAVDAYAAEQPEPTPTRSEAIRRILVHQLTRLGYLTQK